MTNLIIQAFLIVVYFSASTYQIFYTISASMIMVPYLLSAMYYLKMIFREPGMLASKKMNEKAALITALLGTAYGIWMLYSAGLVGLLISALLYAPGTVVYIKGRREQGMPIFESIRDMFFFVLLIGMCIASLIMIYKGMLDPF